MSLPRCLRCRGVVLVERTECRRGRIVSVDATCMLCGEEAALDGPPVARLVSVADLPRKRYVRAAI